MSRWAPWLLFAAALVMAYLTRGILLPFIIGLAVAYLLDPAADRLEALGVPRGAAAGLIIASFFLVSGGLLVLIWPLLQDQIVGLAAALPAALQELRPQVVGFLESLSERLGTDFELNAEGLTTQVTQEGLNRLMAVVSGALSSGLAFFSLVSLLLISPVVAFYLLRDYDRIVARLDEMLPARHRPILEDQWRQIDEALSGFVRGQILIGLIMAAIYAVGWSLVGLNFALVLGLLAGVLSFIPFLGMIAAAGLALIVAFQQFGTDWLSIGLVAGVYLFVQVLEGSVLTPRIMGDRIGLHPVWVLFAVFAGGELAGFVGVLLAVPVAAVVGVLVRFTVERYIKPAARPQDLSS
ncbi:MAG: AI-2E family transporter [Rhodothalassiaceae bacterium]